MDLKKIKVLYLIFISNSKINILKIKLNINSTILKEKNKFRIYINHLELIKIRFYLKPYFISHFLYKLHL